MKKTLFTLLAFLTLGGIAYAQFPQAYKPYSYPVGNGTFNLQGTSSPTFGIITATSTTATSTIYGNLKIGTSAQGTSSPFQITATTTPATPASATQSLTYGSGNYTAVGTYNLITYWVYPYWIVDGVKIFSATPAKTATTSDNGSFQHFKITVSWSAVPKVAGYRVMIYDENIEGVGENTNGRNPYCTEGQGGGNCTRYTYYDTTGTSFVDGDGTEALYAFSDGIGSTKLGVVTPTVSGSDLYVRSDTGDLYSPNGGYFGKSSIGTVTVYRKNNQVVYYNATGTDAYSYGIALTQAVDPSNIQAGDLIVTKSGTYQLNHLLLADGVCLVGQGMENTILTGDNPSGGVRYASANGGYDFINFPASAYSGCIKDLTINIQDLSKNAGIPIEITGASGNTASSTFLFQNLHIIAEADGIFPFNANNNDMVIDMINVHCHTKWDCFNSTSITQKTTINLHDSTLICKGPDTSTTNGQGCSPWATRSTAQPLLTENLYNSLLWAQGGGVQHDVAVSFQAYTGHFNLYNTELRTDATSTTDVASHIILYGGANPTITSFHSYFDPSKITDALGVKTGTTVYGSTLSTTTGMYINGNVGIGTTSPYAVLSVAGSGGVVAESFQATSTTATSLFNGFLSLIRAITPADNAGNSQGLAIQSSNALGIAGTGSSGNVYLKTGNAIGGGVVGDIWIQAGVNGVSGGNVRITGSALGADGNVIINGTSTSKLGVGTTTPNWLLHVAGTRPSIALSDASATTNQKHWIWSSMGGHLYLSTSTDALATTSPAVADFYGTGRPAYELATTSAKSYVLNLGVDPGNLVNGTTTINMGRIQFNGLDSGGAPACTFLGAGAVWIATVGPCK